MKRAVIILLAVAAIPAAAVYTQRDNFDAVIPGKVYRSAQLSGEDLKAVVREHDIRTVINLRPVRKDGSGWYAGEIAAVEELGIGHHTIGMSQTAPRVDNILALRALLDVVEPPLLVHCASGVDRTGLASVMVLLRQGEQSLEEIERQVSWRYGAVAENTIGRVFLEQYSGWLSENGKTHSPEVFDLWLRTEYVDPTGNVHFLIHAIRGKTWWRPYGAGETFEVSRSDGDVLELHGWAFNTKNQTLLADVSITLGGQPSRGAEYGIHFPWLAKHFSNPEYLDSGWAVQLPLGAFSDGCHDLRLTFHRKDDSEWQTPPAARICITP